MEVTICLNAKGWIRVGSPILVFANFGSSTDWSGSLFSPPSHSYRGGVDLQCQSLVPHKVDTLADICDPSGHFDKKCTRDSGTL